MCTTSQKNTIEARKRNVRRVVRLIRVAISTCLQIVPPSVQDCYGEISDIDCLARDAASAERRHYHRVQEEMASQVIGHSSKSFHWCGALSSKCIDHKFDCEP